MADPPFRRKPASHAPPPPALEAFLQGAHTGEVPAEAADMPWAAGRPDVVKTYVLRLSEPYHLKLRYIAEHTPDSMQRFVQQGLYAAIDAKIAEITEET
jgi:hypothetical protein